MFIRSFRKMNQPDIFTNAEASEYLRISLVTLWRERRAGRITYRRVASRIVYLRADLEQYLNKNKREAFNSK